MQPVQNITVDDRVRFTASLANEPLLILAALVTVYIVLGVLYEGFIHPTTILSTLPILAHAVSGCEYRFRGGRKMALKFVVTSRKLLMFRKSRRRSDCEEFGAEAGFDRILRTVPCTITPLSIKTPQESVQRGVSDGVLFRNDDERQGVSRQVYIPYAHSRFDSESPLAMGPELASLSKLTRQAHEDSVIGNPPDSAKIG
jgi:hypothetical protein